MHLQNDSLPFFERTLSDTISQLVARRGLRGHSNSSTLLISPTFATPGCVEDASPTTLNTSLTRLTDDAASRHGFQLSVFARQWAGWRTLVPVARAIATAAGASFLDISTLAGTRPDLHLGAWRRWDSRRQLRDDERDCVHYCLPGPPDTFGRLVYNVLLAVFGCRHVTCTARAQARGQAPAPGGGRKGREVQNAMGKRLAGFGSWLRWREWW